MKDISHNVQIKEMWDTKCSREKDEKATSGWKDTYIHTHICHAAGLTEAAVQVSEQVVPECVSQVAAAALGWPERAVQGDVRLADSRAVQAAILRVRVVAVEGALRTEGEADGKDKK